MSNATSVAVRLTDPADRRHYMTLGPVVSGSDVATASSELADLTAQAALHGQLELVHALTGALVALDRLSEPAAAEMIAVGQRDLTVALSDALATV